MTSHSPSLCSSTFRKNYGKFVMSAYIPETDMAITATTKGYVVVWERRPWMRNGGSFAALLHLGAKLMCFLCLLFEVHETTRYINLIKITSFLL